MDKKNEIFGRRLKQCRKSIGKNQEQVAEQIGISRASYSHYENNHVEPDIDLIRRMADYFNVSSDYLLGRTDVPDVQETDRRKIIINKIATEFPDSDLMFNDLASMTADDLEEVYNYIKYIKSKKD
uniref:helix-turn-helix domain-containing protein n=1 Tax=uncultured Allobacillus sp. TaxID=1638025 RepID=UPI0025930C87|nr:helix-turn-helix transcriptional regulator [uncultured Allobacillus sp.]